MVWGSLFYPVDYATPSISPVRGAAGRLGSKRFLSGQSSLPAAIESTLFGFADALVLIGVATMDYPLLDLIAIIYIDFTGLLQILAQHHCSHSTIYRL